uniref:Canopy FGF signaling regulator 1 n=1 Tax=Cyclopterus lumpus TaxID=8103 RepID=A0A8C3ACP9_CYCLU
MVGAGRCTCLDRLDNTASWFCPQRGERKKTVEFGGGAGVPLARSETHLSDLLDGVCNSMSDYALHVDPDTQHKQYMRFAPRSSGATGDFPDFKNFQFDGPEASNALKFACESVVEELEDDIISLFSKDMEHMHQELCNRVSDYCKDSRNTNEEL